MGHIGALTIHPIKSLDGVRVEHATIAAHGGLAGDRQYAIFDAAGRLVNGKRTSAVHTIRATFDLYAQRVTLGSDTFALGERRMNEWLTDHVGFAVSVRKGTFPDHTRTPGPTIISTATLTAFADAFGLAVDEVRLRFRANIEVSDTSAFDEDRFIGAQKIGMVRCGEVLLHAVEHCSRCVVPSRDPRQGTALPAFAKRVSQWRESTLPEWTDRATLAHFYHLAVLTRVPPTEIGKTVRVGDTVRFEGWAGEQRTARDRLAMILRRILRR
jgi:uncharacterized protein